MRVKEQSENVQINQNVKKGKFEVISSLIEDVTIPWCSWRTRGRTKYVYCDSEATLTRIFSRY